MFICKYCEKECKSLHSLRAHQAVCKCNDNRKIVNHPNWRGFKANTRKWMHKGGAAKIVLKEDIEKYLNDGWVLGVSDEMKNQHKNFKPPTNGRGSTPEKEMNRRKKISESMKGNTNWMFNKKRGNGKKGWYNGIYCDSTWELAFLFYHIDNNLYIKRCDEKREYIYNGEKHTYIPDFITEEGIIEIKGRYDKKAIEKAKQNPDIIIYDVKKMKKFIDYVIDRFGDNFYEKLYESK